MYIKKVLFSLVIILGLLLSACGGATPQPAASQAPVATEAPAQPVTITVWDYYGEATPVKPLIEPFQAAHPNITVKYEAIDWDTMMVNLNVVLTGGEVPDVATVDLTWVPKYAAEGAFTDLKPLSGGMLNGVAWDQAYTAGALKAITYNDQIISALYDFDVYALYYRADLLEAKGLQVPTTWDELMTVAEALHEGEQYYYEFDADTFHGSQWIYENGGTLLSADYKTVMFNSPEAVEGITFDYSLLQSGAAINWTEDEGERIQGVKDGRLAMFSDGPYYMGIMKSAAPEMAGQWRVAQHPFNKQPGSYLGGTVLAIPAKSTQQEAAWEFVQYAMEVQNQVGVYKLAGAAPALTAALSSSDVNVADPYFGGQQAFAVFLQSLETAIPFPYVRQWDEIDSAFINAMQQIALGQLNVQDALDEAAVTVQDVLSK